MDVKTCEIKIFVQDLTTNLDFVPTAFISPSEIIYSGGTNLDSYIASAETYVLNLETECKTKKKNMK